MLKKDYIYFKNIDKWLIVFYNALDTTNYVMKENVMPRLKSLIKTICSGIQLFVFKITKRMYRNSAVVMSGAVVVGVVAFSTAMYGGGGRNVVEAFTEFAPQKDGGDEEGEDLADGFHGVSLRVGRWQGYASSRLCHSHPGAEGQGAEARRDVAEAGAVQALFYRGVAVGLHDVFQRFAFLRDGQLRVAL